MPFPCRDAIPMTPSASPALEALPNPRGAAVRAAETALAEARTAFESHAAVGAPLLRAASALKQAGWLPAQRFADTLVLASPFADGEVAQRFGLALGDFRAALTRRNLRELACSPTLFGHYRALNADIVSHQANASEVAYEDLALAGRPIAPAMMRSLPAQPLARLRAVYEDALLALLRARESTASALDELDRCLAELAGNDPYDVWRLAARCARALRLAGRATSGNDDAKRFYARCNLLLADEARGLTVAPRSFVRAALALLWRDYALYGAAAEDADDVTLLSDYGLTVDWHVAGSLASEVAWEAGAAEAEQRAVKDDAAVREIGALSINASAYEDFLQTADGAMAKLATRAGKPDGSVVPGSAMEARESAEAAYRLGAAACALGLGHIAALAEALGLAWRLTAHARESAAPARAPEPAAIDGATEALRAMLLRVAAGVAPPDANAAFKTIAQAIERTQPIPAGRAS
ncbi:hypothetical protein B0G57_10534 [Trinickia symbiotica]|nr:hypothetical protein B0G57_10534 [Trinickia symbiotica]